MNCTLNKIIIFTVGAAIGSAVTWKVLKDKYARIAQEEIDSVKEVFSRRMSEASEKESKYEYEQKDAEQLVDIIKNNKYAGEEVSFMATPYVISPDEFGENGDEYEIISYTYYADGVLADEMDEIVEDIDDTVGKDSLKHFGEYEDDSVFVRNDRLKHDYEILLDSRRYSDVKKLYQPSRVEG